MLRFRRIVFAAFVLVAPRILAQPDNDMFVNSEELFGTNISTSAYNVDATLEPGEPDHAAWGEAVGSVWYHWRAPRDGYVDLQLVYSSFSYPAASVYTGPTLSNLTVVARSPDWRTGFFEVQAVVVYRIAFASRTSPYSPGFGVISFEL